MVMLLYLVSMPFGIIASSEASRSQVRASFINSHAFSSNKKLPVPVVNQNNQQQQDLIPDLSPYKWFQEIYYTTSNCTGEPFRMQDLILGTCFKDSPKTSFLINLVVDGDILNYYEFSDDKCGKAANSSSAQFTGSKFEDIDTEDPSTASCEVLNDNGEYLSLRTIYFESDYNPVYPVSGRILRYILLILIIYIIINLYF